MDTTTAPPGTPTGDPSVTGRVAVFGDIGGHRDAWWDRLEALGCDRSTLALPDGLAVVQLGDLVHRGPDSAGCVELAEALAAANPGRVALVVGNHEGGYLDGPRFDTGETLDRASVECLARWRSEGLLRGAAAVVRPDGTGVLATHAGLTHAVWALLGAPADAALAASALDGLWATDPETFWRAGVMLTDGRHHPRPDPRASVAWAEAAAELYPSWASRNAPFDQVHGHTSAYDWFSGRWRDPDLAAVASLDRDRRHVAVQLAGATFWGIDPCLGRWGAPRWGPLVLPGRLAGWSAP